MILTNDNYFSPEALKEYFSVSQYHSFVGSPVYPGCEAKTMAQLNGKWDTEPSTAMLVGSYVDEYFSGDLEVFKAKNPDMFTNKGELKAPFKKAEEVIAFAEKDLFFMDYIKGDGEQQVFVTGEIGGAKWKGKIDNLHKGKAIVDLKVVASIREKVWHPVDKIKVDFITASGYIEQGAVYRELHRQMTGEVLPFFIAALTKENVPDKEVIHVPDMLMEQALEVITEKTKYLIGVKNGTYPPVSCGVCDYCRSVKMLENTISLSDLY